MNLHSLLFVVLAYVAVRYQVKPNSNEVFKKNYFQNKSVEYEMTNKQASKQTPHPVTQIPAPCVC